MTAAGLPTHLSVLALRASPLTVAAGTTVLVVENPRLVEAAAERRLVAAVLCTNGNPTTTPGLAITQLWSCGARMRYHGDFDAAGLALAVRARDAGCEPFRMSAPDYYDALVQASAAGVELPRDPPPSPPIPWNPDLASAFNEHHAIVHEERVMDDVLAATRPTVERRASSRPGGSAPGHLPRSHRTGSPIQALPMGRAGGEGAA